MARRPKKTEEKPQEETVEAVVETAKPETDAAIQDSETLEGLAPLSRLLGYDPNTLRKWRAEGMPCEFESTQRGVPSRFNVRDVHKWIVDREVKKALEAAGPSGSGDEDDPEAKYWDVRKKMFDALRSEQALADDRKVMIRMDDAVREREMADAAVRTALKEFPDRWAVEVSLSVSPLEAHGILTKAIDEVLDNLVVVFEDAPEIESEEEIEAEFEGDIE